MKPIVTEKKLEEALHYLASTDEEFARAKGYLYGQEKREKTILGMEILKLKGKGGTVPEKDAEARSSVEYTSWLETYENAVADYELMRNKRDTAHAIIEVWRSLNSARTKGVIL